MLTLCHAPLLWSAVFGDRYPARAPKHREGDLSLEFDGAFSSVYRRFYAAILQSYRETGDVGAMYQNCVRLTVESALADPEICAAYTAQRHVSHGQTPLEFMVEVIDGTALSVILDTHFGGLERVLEDDRWADRQVTRLLTRAYDRAFDPEGPWGAATAAGLTIASLTALADGFPYTLTPEAAAQTAPGGGL